jgi:hypothetical protein
MHIAFTPAHRAVDRTEVGADGVQHGFTERKPAGRVTDKGGKHIAFPERNTDGRAQGFLTATKEHPAMDFAGAVKRGKLFVQQPRAQHETVRDQMPIASVFLLLRLRVGGGLQHEGILTRAGNRGNDSFIPR